MKEALISYIADDGIVHGLDFTTEAKYGFIQAFEEKILTPRRMDYRFQFTGPTGANGVEAALKLARLHTGRNGLFAFKRGYHGLSLGALAATYNPFFRRAAGTLLEEVQFFEYNSECVMDALAQAGPKPAAVILEAIQGEGGVYPADAAWLRALAKAAKDAGVLLIVDDIQAGCGRSGDFFSFEFASIQPDIIVLSKSISGFGQPMTLVLNRPSVDDTWGPAQHTGTFRGNNLAFITARVAVDKFWSDNSLSEEVFIKGEKVREALSRIPGTFVRGRGLFNGLVFENPALAAKAASICFERGLLIETAGMDDEVLKIMPSLTIPEQSLAEGLSIVKEAALSALEKEGSQAKAKIG